MPGSTREAEAGSFQFKVSLDYIKETLLQTNKKIKDGLKEGRLEREVDWSDTLIGHCTPCTPCRSSKAQGLIDPLGLLSSPSPILKQMLVQMNGEEKT